MNAICGEKQPQPLIMTTKQPKMFLDIPSAAKLAGLSVRHFRRIADEDKIPIIQISRKFFILGRDFSTWLSAKKTMRRRRRHQPLL